MSGKPNRLGRRYRTAPVPTRRGEASLPGRAPWRALPALILLLTLFTGPAIAQSESSLSVEHAERVAPGEVLLLTVKSSEPLEELSAMLSDGGRVLSDNSGVPFEEDEEGRERWVVLLGVVSTIRPGEYEVVVDGAPGAPSYEGNVEVTAREFVEEDIPLSQTLTELRRDEDPRKREQALEMLALTNSFRRESTFWTGSFSMPLESNRRTSQYGDRRRFIYADGEIAHAIHNGVDLAAPTGTPIYAPGAGKVVFAEDRIVTGKTVVLEHFPGVYGLFYHLDRIDVEQGELVEKGTSIGTVGSTGVSTGPHLHWEMRVGGVSVDPGPFLETPLVDTSGGIGAVSD
ncbi:MAG: M23 family metallopeptidase [Spirochaetaceae bacterium]